MAGEALEELPPWEEEGSPGFGPVPSVEEIRSNLRQQPKPSIPTDYNTLEAAFWMHRHLPAGSVMVYKDPEYLLEPPVHVAVLVMSTESRQEGMWVLPKVLGATNETVKKKVVNYFKSKKKRIHLCSPARDEECLDEEFPALHLTQFKWYPPGDFSEDWIGSRGKKAVAEGPKMQLAEEKQQVEPGHAEPGREQFKPVGKTVADRLEELRRPSALRGRGPRVSFAAEPERRSIAGDAAGHRARAGDGTGTLAVSYGPLVARGPALQKTKTEVIEVDEERVKEEKRPKKRSASLGQTLALAARAHSRTEESKKKKKKRRRSRSRSGSKRSKKKKKDKDSSQESSEKDESSSDSSSESLMPPLKKKALRTPGAVYKMLESHMAEKLSQEADLGPGGENEGQRPKFHTYYQLCLRPQLDPRSRDCKELSLLSRLLDQLRAGQLEALADTVAARLMAVDAATRQGWQTAKYLEIDYDGEEGCAPPHVLLAAQRHGRLVEKAGGKGSWPRQQSWPSQVWSEEPRKGKGKDAKGKGKKGRGKGKGQKGQWGAWYAEEKPKGAETTRKEGEK